MERIDHAADLSRSSLGSALALAQTHDAARKEALQVPTPPGFISI